MPFMDSHVDFGCYYYGGGGHSEETGTGTAGRGGGGSFREDDLCGAALGEVSGRARYRQWQSSPARPASNVIIVCRIYYSFNPSPRRPSQAKKVATGEVKDGGNGKGKSSPRKPYPARPPPHHSKP